MNDPDPLFGAKLKSVRARELYDQLREPVNTFLESDPNEISAERDPDRPEELVIRIRKIREPDPYWGVLIGDVLHNARSALEYAIFELGINDSGAAFYEPDPVTGRRKRTQFPIFDTEAEFENRGIPMLPGLSERHRAVIEGLQPYHGINRGPRHPLAALRDLANADKHRVLHTLSTVTTGVRPGEVVSFGGFGVVEVVGFDEGPVVDGAEVGRLRKRASASSVSVHMNLQITMRIAINGEWPLRETMLGIVGFVEHEALPRLAAEFP
jgi:hypothetical protein